MPPLLSDKVNIFSSKFCPVDPVVGVSGAAVCGSLSPGLAKDMCHVAESATITNGTQINIVLIPIFTLQGASAKVCAFI